jgi:hypothetical protein
MQDPSSGQDNIKKTRGVSPLDLIKPFPSSSGFSSALAKNFVSTKKKGRKIYKVGSPSNTDKLGRGEGFEDPLGDLFQGPATLKNLSSRLAVGPDEEISNEEVVNLLGEEVLEAFRYAQKRMQGLCRRTTREPAFCHSADVALRAHDLGYSAHVLKVCFLHDIAEDLSTSLMEVSLYLHDIASRFGRDVSNDVRVLTNRYDVIIDSLKRRIPGILPFENESLGVIKAELEKMRDELPHPYREEYAFEFHQLLDYFLNQVSISRGARIARMDKRYTIISELGLQVYNIFIEEICDYSRYHDGFMSSSFYEVPLVVKFLDMVDNLRTSEIGNWMVLEKIMMKAEFILDKSFFLHDHIRSLSQSKSTFILLYDFLKNHLIEQLNERKRALSFLADTRFAFLGEYLVKQISRLQEKYKVEKSTIEELSKLRAKIRKINLSK